MPTLTPELARELAAKSHEARRKNLRERELEELGLHQQAQIAKEAPTDDPIASALREQIVETIREYASCDEPKGKAALAQALRNLRETWHMVTGESKPGNRKPTTKPTNARPRIEPVVGPADSSSVSTT